MASSETRRWRIEGRVQGVFFRASTRRKAQSLDLTGHARNLEDGAVDVLAHGHPDALDTLHTWLQKGPPAANVTAVRSIEVDSATVPSGFETA